MPNLNYISKLYCLFCYTNNRYKRISLFDLSSRCARNVFVQLVVDSDDTHSLQFISQLYSFSIANPRWNETRRHLQFKSLGRIPQQLYIVDRNWLCIIFHSKFMYKKKRKHIVFRLYFIFETARNSHVFARVLPLSILPRSLICFASMVFDWRGALTSRNTNDGSDSVRARELTERTIQLIKVRYILHVPCSLCSRLGALKWQSFKNNRFFFWMDICSTR